MAGMRGSTSDGKLIISAWDISQYYYCKRKVYFLKTLGVPAPPKRKMEYGKKVDENEKRKIMNRQTIYGYDKSEVEEIIEKLHIIDEELGLEGEIDQTIILKSGEIIPVDIKYTDQTKIQKHHKKQLTAYAILLDKHYNTNVKKAIIRLAKQRKDIEITITWQDKENLIKELKNIKNLIQKEEIPRPTTPTKCKYCEVRKYCQAYK